MNAKESTKDLIRVSRFSIISLLIDKQQLVSKYMAKCKKIKTFEQGRKNLISIFAKVLTSIFLN